MKITLIKDDKTIIKNNKSFVGIEDNSFWSNFNDVHAIQIDDENNLNEVELANGGTREATQEEINLISERFEKVEEDLQKEKDDYFNSWDRVKRERNSWLYKTDTIMVEDFPVSSSFKENIKSYRNSLRDLPNTYSSTEPKTITFDENGNVSVNGDIVINYPSN
tara:strand:+ start:335 stop:826 length:492 start_codon:yes stop_codon:yes gene_type:complete